VRPGTIASRACWLPDTITLEKPVTPMITTLPRQRYIERRGYYEERGPGFGFQAPGVSVGIGTGRY
jgi:hypothetical protein